MRYFLENTTLFIRGSFRAASTGIAGGVARVSTLLNHTVLSDWDHEAPEKELELVAAGAGIGRDFFGLLTAVSQKNLCVLQYDFLTVFITAGIRDKPAGPEHAGTINIIICSIQGMSDAALLETIMIAAGAKAEALAVLGRNTTGTPTDAIIAACEGEVVHRYAGSITPVGTRLRAAVLYGVPEAIRKHEAGAEKNRPSFFIFSRFKGDHWVEWTPEDCPYFPCHFPGQRCDFCYCPLYPCSDEALGQWVESASGGMVWNCARCTMIHEPAVAQYLKTYPEASKDELVRFWKAQKK